jgi:hypothetical protein
LCGGTPIVGRLDKAERLPHSAQRDNLHAPLTGHSSCVK